MTDHGDEQQADEKQQRVQHLARLAIQVMPFGRFSGYYLSDLPEAYLLWFRDKGWPAGQLGRDLAEMLEIKVAGCDGMLRKWRTDFAARQVPPQ